MNWGIELAERGRLPEFALRAGIRRLLRGRLQQIGNGGEAAIVRRRSALLTAMRRGPIAVATREANEQHYEVPAEFFHRVLGARLKYSGCYWPDGVETLDAAEEAMLELTCERAGVEDGMELLDLGCGWGSLALWLAERYPQSRVLAVSNSDGQRRFIERRAAERGLERLEVVTRDVNDFHPGRTFDRVLSVEMFEHMRNYRELLARIASWLAPGGRLFVHVFCHRERPYLFERDGGADWMARHFFTGGLMPSADLFLEFGDDLQMEKTWLVDGRHYERTARAWQHRLEADRKAIVELFGDVYGAAEARRWFHRWRLFFLACAELFAYNDGQEWLVGHYRLRPGGGT
jgi:cyclopropane-fatty-acyl-phospholipid synthase